MKPPFSSDFPFHFSIFSMSTLLTDQEAISGAIETPDVEFDAPAQETAPSAEHSPDLPMVGSIGKTIQADLFRTGVLLHVTASVYSGLVGQDEEDLRVQGLNGAAPGVGDPAQNADRHLFIPGQKRLIRKEALEPFTQWRNRIKGYLQGVSTPFIDLDAVRLVNRSLIRQVLDRLAEFQNELDGLVDAFMGLDDANYRAEQQVQASIFDQRYPERAGYLTQFFLAPGAVRRKFGLRWKPFEVSEVSDAERANLREEEVGAIREQMGNYNEELNQQFRQLSQKRLIAIAKAINAKGKINGEYVCRLSDELEKLQAFNFGNDARTTELLESVRRHALNVQDWKTDAEGKKELARIIEEGERQLQREIEENDLVIVQRNRRGQAAVIEEEFEGASEDEDSGEDAIPQMGLRRVGQMTDLEISETEESGQSELPESQPIARVDHFQDPESAEPVTAPAIS
jgi:hypothetical protein